MDPLIVFRTLQQKIVAALKKLLLKQKIALKKLFNLMSQVTKNVLYQKTYIMNERDKTQRSQESRRY